MEIKPLGVEFCQLMLKDAKRIIEGLCKELENTECTASIEYLQRQIEHGNYEIEHWNKNLQYAKDYYLQ